MCDQRLHKRHLCTVFTKKKLHIWTMPLKRPFQHFIALMLLCTELENVIYQLYLQQERLSSSMNRIAFSHAGENFLQAKLNNNSILILCTAMCLQALFLADTIFVDGTFITVPHMFQQLFTLHTMCNGRLMPRVYVLTATKSRQGYIDVFRWLRDTAVTMRMVFQLNVVYSDFETGFIAAIAHKFPATHHQGCYFHVIQAIWRNIQRLGLVHSYNENGPHRSIMRQLMALAFLPLAIVRNNFRILRDTQPADQLLEPLFHYFVNQRLYGVPPIMWNVNNVDMRTNNHVEGKAYFIFGIYFVKHLFLFEFLKVGTTNSTLPYDVIMPIFGISSYACKANRRQRSWHKTNMLLA